MKEEACSEANEQKERLDAQVCRMHKRMVQESFQVVHLTEQIKDKEKAVKSKDTQIQDLKSSLLTGFRF